jgi:hypothetical protein
LAAHHRCQAQQNQTKLAARVPRLASRSSNGRKSFVHIVTFVRARTRSISAAAEVLIECGLKPDFRTGFEGTWTGWLDLLGDFS